MELDDEAGYLAANIDREDRISWPVAVTTCRTLPLAMTAVL